MHLLDRHIVNRLDAGRLDRLDRGGEALAVQAAAVGSQQVFESLGLGVVLEADALGEHRQVVAGNHQFVRGLLRVVALPTTAIGQQCQTGRPAVAVDRRQHAQPQQQALGRFEQRCIGLRQAHADAFVLAALHRTVGVEQAAQQAAAEIGRASFDRRRDGLAAWRHAERQRQPAQGA